MGTLEHHDDEADVTEAAVYRNFFDRSLDLLCTVDERMCIQHANPAWTTVLGWSPEELRGRAFPELVHDDDRDSTLQAAGQLMADPDCTLVNFECRFRHKEGRWVPLAWSVAVHDGMFFASARDMSKFEAEQDTLERALADASEARVSLQTILQSANYIIIGTAPDGTIREWNRAAERQLGYTEEEVVGKTSPAILHDLDEVVARAAALTAELGVAVEPGFGTFIAKARNGIPDENEWTYVRKDGSRFPVALSVTARFDEAGEVVGYVGIGQDLTERNIAQAELEESEARLRSIIESAVDAMITIEESGRIEATNPAVAKLFGYERGELVGQNVRVLMGSPDQERHDTYLSNYRSTGERKIIGIGREVIAVRKDGSTFPADLSVSEFKLQGRGHFTGVVRDISDRKRVERLQSEFVSTVSHELRTPLTSIRGSLGLIAGGVLGELPPDAAEYVQIALSNSDRLVRLINDILDLEKMQSGTMEFRFEAMSLSAAVESAVLDNRAFAASHDVTIDVGSIPVGEVLVDPDRLAQALTNLLSNAAKFSPKGGVVEVGVERVADRFRVNVRDHGPGIPKEFEGRIFQRFAQADASTTRAKGGTGLGLSITKSIVERMRGRIGFSAAEGGGTNFHIELPFLPPVRHENQADNSARVLVCEDDPDVSRVLETLLRSDGYAVDTSPTLERARRLLAAHHYDAVTLDLQLADGDGSVLIQELRSDERTRDLPIVVVSAFSAGVLGDNAVLVNDIITKPFDETRLLGSVSQALRATSEGAVPRLLHVEDDPDLRRIMRKTLPEDWDVVSVDSVHSAKEALAGDAFDLVLLDLSLPDGWGAEILGMVGTAQVIVFSAQDASADLSRRVSAALVKSQSSPADVHDRIVGLLRRHKKYR